MSKFAQGMLTGLMLVLIVGFVNVKLESFDLKEDIELADTEIHALGSELRDLTLINEALESQIVICPHCNATIMDGVAHFKEDQFNLGKLGDVK